MQQGIAKKCERSVLCGSLLQMTFLFILLYIGLNFYYKFYFCDFKTYTRFICFVDLWRGGWCSLDHYGSNNANETKRP